MSTRPTQLPATLPEDVPVGPALAALNPMQRRFVLALVNEVTPGPHSLAEAVRLAGYAADNAYSVRNRGHDLSHNPAVIDAIIEVARQNVALQVPQALRTIKDVMDALRPADRLKAALAILDRVAPVRQEISVTTEVIDNTRTTLDYLRHQLSLGTPREVLVREYGQFGLERFERMLLADAAKVVDAEFEVVEAPPVAAATPALATAPPTTPKRRGPGRPKPTPIAPLQDWEIPQPEELS